MKFLLLALLFFPLAAAADQDDDFLAARDAFRAGNGARFEQAAARLKNSPLEPYIAYYRLKLQLETADTPVVLAFLARTDDTPVVDRLRADWLKLLGKRGQWDLFDAEYPKLVTNNDTELDCYRWQSLLHKDENAALAATRRLWLSTGEDQPDSCAAMFGAALAAGVITPSDIVTRVRLALEEGNVSLAKRLSEKLPAGERLPEADLTLAANNPQRYFKRAKLEHATEAERRVALFALLRLAKQSPQLALAQWENISGNFNVAEQHYFYAWMGYEGAYRQDARALEWYRMAGDYPLNDAQRAWRARAALRALNWQEVHNSITAMSPEQQQEQAWRYWSARALKQLGRTEEASAVFSGLSGEFNFYGQLAADELGIADQPAAAPAAYHPTQAEIDALTNYPPIARALALYRMDLRTDAAKEWGWAVKKFDDRKLLTVAEIARRNEMYDRAINTADKTTQLHDFGLRYLAPYRDVLHGPIRQNNLEESWVYGLMRQESRFVTQAKSNVGASGLMQVMPQTARWIARKLGIKGYRKKFAERMDTNIVLGTYYMKTVLGWFDNSPVMASAAYNAGPSRARQWRGDIPLEGAIYAETIPFSETRDYVKKVMSNTVYYAQQFGEPARPLKERMGIIAARNAQNQTPIPDEK
jgi:soluble lytic murein transglycosylase